MNGRQTRVLLIEDNPGDALLLEEMLADAGHNEFALEWTDRLTKGLALLAAHSFDVVLLDLTLPDSKGLNTFQVTKAAAPALPIVVLSGLRDETLALSAVQDGAQDYLVKGQVNGPFLVRAVRYAIERKQTEFALAETAAQLQRSNERLQALASAERQARMELQRAHEELKRTQSELFQSAKLASLGQLVAGVAHEINNPLAFVTNNNAIAQRDTQTLRELIRLYMEADAILRDHLPDLHGRIRDLADQMDLSYLLENQESLLLRSGAGLKRIRGIVQDLSAFGRVDTGVREAVDVNAGVESTLNILRGEAEHRNVQLHGKLEALPQIACNPAKINQVVLNLVANAMEACSQGGQIHVHTRSVPTGIEIIVQDSGCGIDPAIRDQIFDPFFTTKVVGQGMGLGLSISHGIVKEHGGSIEVDSTVGQGAHFKILLPLRPPVNSSQASNTTRDPLP